MFSIERCVSLHTCKLTNITTEHFDTAPVGTSTIRVQYTTGIRNECYVLVLTYVV